jgi:hypothetical protein
MLRLRSLARAALPTLGGACAAMAVCQTTECKEVKPLFHVTFIQTGGTIDKDYPRCIKVLLAGARLPSSQRSRGTVS